MKSKAAATIIMSVLILTGLTACNGKQDCNSTQQALVVPDSVAEKGGSGGGGHGGGSSGGHSSGGSAGSTGHGTAGEGSAGHGTTSESNGGTTAKGGSSPVFPFIGGGSGSCKK